MDGIEGIITFEDGIDLKLLPDTLDDLIPFGFYADLPNYRPVLATSPYNYHVDLEGMGVIYIVDLQRIQHLQ